ncbi:transaldolase [Streptomyces phaeofaciens]|uniref:transaldolase n=1 Tax=Streptomyces phaeofaciens TaxID=68254 RepID=UPI003684A3DC
MITVTEATAPAEALKRLSDEGVSIWLDDLSRKRIRSGNLAELVATRHVVGVTTNPSIFQAAIGTGEGYEDQLADLAVRGVTVDEAVRMMTTADVRAAADILHSVHLATDGRDGRVSIEVDPRLAHDTAATVAEAKQLAWLVDRPNVMVKIPATKAGLPAITEVIGLGISVNVTLIFSLERYREVMDAYLAGLEKARANGFDLSTIHSVASFFVSRVDADIDRQLTALGTDRALALKGKAALANARLAYEAYEEVFGSADGSTPPGDRWTALAGAKATRQRPLWASTGVKDPAYKDTLYVDELVAAGTVNTMPEATLNATADHGDITGDTVTGGYDRARADLAAVAALGISYDEVVTRLEDDGVAKFETAWEDLLNTVTKSLTSKAAEASEAADTNKGADAE